jgi:hypothetical protein
MIAAYEKPFLERVEKILRASLNEETIDISLVIEAAAYLAMDKAHGTGFRPICLACGWSLTLETSDDGSDDRPGWWCTSCAADAYDGPECDQEGNLL